MPERQEEPQPRHARRGDDADDGRGDPSEHYVGDHYQNARQSGAQEAARIVTRVPMRTR